MLLLDGYLYEDTLITKSNFDTLFNYYTSTNSELPLVQYNDNMARSQTIRIQQFKLVYIASYIEEYKLWHNPFGPAIWQRWSMPEYYLYGHKLLLHEWRSLRKELISLDFSPEERDNSLGYYYVKVQYLTEKLKQREQYKPRS